MYIIPSEESAAEMLERIPEGPFLMLNLYRLRDVADYADYPEHAPTHPISGRELFDRYAREMLVYLDDVGGKRIFLADGGFCLIGPSSERWDVVQMISYPSMTAFATMMSKQEIVDALPHRYAMLEDSRVFPMLERKPE